MRFGILGPLAVADGERQIVVPGAKSRPLLVLHGGRVVPTDRLVDGLWGEHLPADPANALQALVSRLRRALDPSGELALLRSHPSGYLLAVDPEQVDAVRFQRLAAQGHAALAAGWPDAAAALLAEGLALWRGPALAEVAHESFAEGEVTRLTELRLAAVEDRVEADLALGRHAAVVGELDALVAEHPLRERLRGQLMRALYRRAARPRRWTPTGGPAGSSARSWASTPARGCSGWRRRCSLRTPGSTCRPRRRPVRGPTRASR